MTDNDTTQNDETQVDTKTELTLLKQRAGLMGIKFSNNITVDTLKAKIEAKLAADEGDEPAVDDDGEDDNDLDNDGHDDDNGEFVNGNQEAANADPVLVTGPIPVEDEAPIAAPVAAAPVAPVIAPIPAPIVAAPVAAAPATIVAAPLNPLAPEAAPPPVSRRLTKIEENIALRQRLHDEGMKLLRVRITNLDPKKADLPGEIFTVANEYLGTVRKYIPYGDVTENGFHIPKCIYDQLVERKFLMIRTVKDRRTGTTRPETRWVTEFSLDVMEPLTQEELDRLAISQAAAGSMDEFAS